MVVLVDDRDDEESVVETTVGLAIVDETEVEVAFTGEIVTPAFPTVRVVVVVLLVQVPCEVAGGLANNGCWTDCDCWTGGVCNFPAATELYGIPGIAGGVCGKGDEMELLALLTWLNKSG